MRRVVNECHSISVMTANREGGSAGFVGAADGLACFDRAADGSASFVVAADGFCWKNALLRSQKVSTLPATGPLRRWW